jgi:hypothetical protein
VTADTVIDGELSTQGWNRYSYVINNPIIYKNPTGHRDLAPGQEPTASAPTGVMSFLQQSSKQTASTPASNTSNNNVANNLKAAKDAQYTRGAEVRKEMMDNLTDVKNDGYYHTKIGDTQIRIMKSTLSGDQSKTAAIKTIDNMDSKALEVFEKMTKDESLQLTRVDINSLSRSRLTATDPHQFNDGRLSTSIDIGGAKSALENLGETKFRDDNESTPASPNALATKMTNWLKDSTDVKDVFTPWKMIYNRAEPVANDWRSDPVIQRDNSNDYGHKHHLHFNVNE